MTAHFSVNNSEALTGSYIPPEITCYAKKTIPETEVIASAYLKNKSYIIKDGKITPSETTTDCISVTIEWEFETVSYSALSTCLWNNHLETQYEGRKIQEKSLNNARKHFTFTFTRFFNELSEFFAPQKKSKKSYLKTTGDELVFWANDISVVYDLKKLNNQIFNVLFQHSDEHSQNKYGPSKGWFLDITKIKHSRAKWAIALFPNFPLVNNGLNRILELIRRFHLCDKTHRDTMPTYLHKSIVKCFGKLKTGIRSVEDMKNGNKEKSDSKGQRLGISQTAHSRFFTWT